VPFGQLLVLGALAGLTIFLGLPFAALTGIKASVKGALTGVATGILAFLTIDILGDVLGPGEQLVKRWAGGGSASAADIADLVFLVAGVFAGLVAIPFFEGRLARLLSRRKGAPTQAEQRGAGAPVQETPPGMMALSIASGIGLHNFSEGLAIGQSAASGAASLAVVLIVGFGLHNMTEGFGIAAPLTDTKPSKRFILLLGLIGGGPTFLGTLVGASWSSPLAATIFLSLAGGALIYVTAELLRIGRRALKGVPLMSAVAGGFFLGYFTEILVGVAMGG
jgi:zinc transporter, ZIP family